MEPTAIVPQVDQPPASSPGMSAAPSSVPPQDHAALRRRRRRRRVRSFSTPHGTQSKGDPPMSTRLMARLGAGSGIAYVGIAASVVLVRRIDTPTLANADATSAATERALRAA